MASSACRLANPAIRKGGAGRRRLLAGSRSPEAGITFRGRQQETPMLWVGLDLHKHYITACAMDETGVILAEHRRLPADDTTLLGWLGALPGPVTVAMEATHQPAQQR